MIETVYVAGPYGSDPRGNMERALMVADRLFQEGFSPFVPHLCYFWDERFPHTYEEWLAYDEVWIPKCDALLVWGPADLSPGTKADIEVADKHHVPTYFTLHDLLEAGKT